MNIEELKKNLQLRDRAVKVLSKEDRKSVV